MEFSSKNTGLGCHSLLQGVFVTHGSKPSLLHGRQRLYQLNQEGRVTEHHKNISFQIKTVTLPKKGGKKKWVGWDSEPGSLSPGPRRWALDMYVHSFWFKWISLRPVTCLIEALDSLPNSGQPPLAGSLVPCSETRATHWGPALGRFLTQNPKNAPCLRWRAIHPTGAAQILPWLERP